MYANFFAPLKTKHLNGKMSNLFLKFHLKKKIFFKIGFETFFKSIIYCSFLIFFNAFNLII